MLKLAGEGIIAEVIERLAYSPGLQDSGDLEPATRTITATVEATGIANADYSAVLTIPAPSDSRLSVLRIAARLAGTIDSMTAGPLYGRVYVDVQDANHRLFDLNWTTTGAKLAVVDTHSANLAAIFNLLKDGAAHTFYFFFWVNAGNAVISLVELWEAVGASNTDWWGAVVISLTHSGLVSSGAKVAIVGTGTYTHMLLEKSGLPPGSVGSGTETGAVILIQSTSQFVAFGETTCVVKDGVEITLKGSVATDLNYIYGCSFVLRSEQ